MTKMERDPGPLDRRRRCAKAGCALPTHGPFSDPPSSMRQARLNLLLALLVACPLAGCAAGGYAPASTSMPAARAALRPEYRLFYDALQDYGDWVLIEPLGFVFRPRVD